MTTPMNKKDLLEATQAFLAGVEILSIAVAHKRPPDEVRDAIRGYLTQRFAALGLTLVKS